MLSWSSLINQIHIRIKTLSLTHFPKRVSFSFPFFLKAGITLEGCLVLPLFLFFMATLLYSLEMVRFQSDVYEAMHQVGSDVCFSAYELVYGQGSSASQKKDMPAEEVMHYLSRQLLPYLCVEGGSDGIDILTKEDACGSGNIEITVSYALKPFVRWLPIGNIRIKDGCFFHGFVGYKGSDAREEKGEHEVYVYITPSGSKYHLSEHCSYLRIHVKTASAEEVSFLRNASGEKYYSCEYCRPGERGLVYLTEWGNRYHGKADCTALKRTVYIVPLSKVGTRTACSKCG